jgi:hypothetical protein
MNRTRGSFAIVVALLLGLALTSCRGGGTTEIKTLLDDPARFDRQTVRIAGTVDGSAGILGYGTYHVDDGTGKLWVVTQSGGAPRNGARVGVEGEFRSAFTLGDRTGAVLMESRRYTP